MRENSFAMRCFYGTAGGRACLKLLQKTHADRLAVRCLRSPLSKPLIVPYARRHGIPLSRQTLRSYRTFRDFFARTREPAEPDTAPGHLNSPCDGWLSVYPVEEGCSFSIKGSRYRVEDLLGDAALAERFLGGQCLIFRLTPSDYHHYSYIDDGRQGENHFIEGTLHSVQPIACERYPVFTLNRRSWCLMETERFGPVVQTEIGAMLVGGIENELRNALIRRGSEKGHFELAGSTIVLLFEAGRIRLRPALAAVLAENDEVRVEQGMWIADRCGEETP